MANITPASSNIGAHLTRYIWETMLDGDTGLAVEMGASADKTMQITGTFGAGGSVNIEGSNDGTNWEILEDADGGALTFTSADLQLIRDNPQFIRANCTAGDGTTDLDVTIVAKRTS